jgi:predicted alpha/beta-fold hydrolase
MVPYRAPAWLPGGHLQTLYSALAAPRPRVSYRRERWETPDGDFIDLDWLEQDSGTTSGSDSAPATVIPAQAGIQYQSWTPASAGVTTSANVKLHAPLVVLFHGLEGGSRSHYALALMAALQDSGCRGVVIHFRGCSGEPNRLQRAYHSGDAQEVDWILRRFRAHNSDTPLYAVGVSLGGNALLKWLGESGAAATRVIDAAVAISAPLDLMVSGDALGGGFNLIYANNFLRTLKAKSLAKLQRFPGLYDANAVRASRTLRAFDNVVTAPLHGYRDTDDYWTRASSKPLLKDIAVPTLLINARNDPFLPARALPRAQEVSAAVTLEQPQEGGHVGFTGGAFPGNFDWLPRRILDFLARR